MHVARAGADAVAADIGVMDGRAEIGDDPSFAENRGDDGDVEEMAGGQPRIVGDQDVALGQAVGREFLNEMRAGGGQRVDMAGRAGHGLGDHPAFAVQQGAGEIACFAHHGAESDALQGAGLFAGRADQVAPEDFELDTVHCHRQFPCFAASLHRFEDSFFIVTPDLFRGPVFVAERGSGSRHRACPGRDPGAGMTLWVELAGSQPVKKPVITRVSP